MVVFVPGTEIYQHVPSFVSSQGTHACTRKMKGSVGIMQNLTSCFILYHNMMCTTQETMTTIFNDDITPYKHTTC